MRRVALWAGLIFALDQLTKWAVVQRLNLKEIGEYDFFEPFLVFRMAWNRGVNFGLFSSDSEAARWILIAVALAISVWVLLWVRREGGKWVEISAGILVGGALGNVVDRVAYGAVADFLNMSCCGIENPYSFNVADIAIFVGAIGLVVFTGPRGNTPTRRKTSPRSKTP
jgi:signal peptidase II